MMDQQTTFGIDRLEYRLKDFTRYAWVSEQAREKWEPRLNRIIECWLEIEWRSVSRGIRSCGLRTLRPEIIDQRRKELAAVGLELKLLDRIAMVGNYTSQFKTPKEGEDYVHWSVIGNSDDLELFSRAWADNDQRELGRLLGYPGCCTAFFEQTWVKSHFIDTTWPMAFNSEQKESQDARAIAVTGPFQSNMLLRWLGPRLVFHLPCSFQCAATVELANRFQGLALELGYEEEMAWLQEALSWPVEWTALHGIAEIRTPVVKVATATDATPFKYSVRYEGDEYPDVGAVGLNFPHRQPERLKFTDTKAFNRGLEHPIPTPDEAVSWTYTDNGFVSRAAMDDAHQPLVDLANEVLQGKTGQILDLGCGNGLLLKKITNANPRLRPFGIDGDPQRVAHAKVLHPDCPHHFIAGNMFEPNLFTGLETSFELVILMLGRLTEVDAPKRNFLHSFLRDSARNVLVYVYDDYRQSHGALEDIAENARIELLKVAGNVGLARFAGRPTTVS